MASDPMAWLKTRMIAQGDHSPDDVIAAICEEDIPRCAAGMLIELRRAMALPDSRWRLRNMVPLITVCNYWLRDSILPATVARHPQLLRVRGHLCALATAIRAGGDVKTLHVVAANALRVLAGGAP